MLFRTIAWRALFSLMLLNVLPIFPTAVIAARNVTRTNPRRQPLSTPLEILTIPTNGDPVSTSTALATGTQYTVRLSGTWVWGGCDPQACPEGGPDHLRWGDAGYLTDNHWIGFASSYRSSHIYLEVNGSRANVGAYSSDHIYRLSMTGNGSPITFRIHDISGCYGDNAGPVVTP